MTKIGTCMLILPVFVTLGVTAQAQDARARETSGAAGPAVTISLTERGVRFAALGSFGKMRLEVFNADGTSLHNSDFAAGSVRDWVLDSKDGQLLPDGTYLCVITIRDLSGRLTTKQGSVVLQGGQPSLKMPDGESVEVVQPDKSLARVTDPPDNALTLIGHDGKNGQVVNTRGALTFRFGDFFGGKDKELMRLTPEGNLGLGVKSPQAKLDVAGTIRTGGIEFANGTVQTTGLSGRVDAQGNVVPATTGTGTQGRLAKWMDNGGTLGDSLLNETGNFIELRATSGSGVNPTITNPNSTPNFAQFQFYPASGANTNMSFATIPRGAGVANNRAQISVFGTDFLADQANYEFAALRARGTDFVMGTGRSGNGLNRPFMLAAGFLADNLTNNGQLFLDTTGYVGIGTTTPQSPLDVNGNFNVTGNATVSGNIAAKYQDIAEWTSARTELPSGTVVSLDTLQPNSVLASNKAYDTRVAGVVSAQPGVILGVGGPNRVLVATTGRVKVRVNANRYPIKIGDLLVTSDKPGVAMKSQPFRVRGKVMHRPGTIIGKALESLSRGEGTILVLLSLQ